MKGLPGLVKYGLAIAASWAVAHGTAWLAGVPHVPQDTINCVAMLALYRTIR